MIDQDLIHHLRNSKGWPTLENAAADKIEELTAERDRMVKLLFEIQTQICKAEACSHELDSIVQISLRKLGKTLPYDQGKLEKAQDDE